MGECAEMVLDGILDRMGDYTGNFGPYADRDKEEDRRDKYAKEQLFKLGIVPTFSDGTEIRFMFKGEEVKFFPYTGWATGKSIKDGRGIKNLIKQLTV